MCDGGKCMCVNKKILISDYDQTFYLNDNDIEKNKIAIKKFREQGNLLSQQVEAILILGIKQFYIILIMIM